MTMLISLLAIAAAIGSLVCWIMILIKLFQGVGFDEYLRSLRAGFTRVNMRKPKASRARSREVYALAVGLKPSAVLPGENRA